MTQPRVLFVSDVPDFKGGAERSLFDLMSSPYIEPVLCVPERGEIYDAAHTRKIAAHIIHYGSVRTVRRPFKVRDVFRTFFDALSAARQLKNLAAEKKVLCVHTNGLKAHGTACLARLIGGPPVIIHFRAIPFTRLEKLFWKAVQMIAARVILVSRPCWPGKTLPSNVQVIFNGIVLPDRDLVPRPQTKEPFTLGFVGRIQFTKGVDTLIEWMDYACSRGMNIALRIRGEAAPDELDYDRKCRRMVTDRKLDDRIVFEGRVQGFQNIYGGIHANVVSSVIPDPLPRSVMEACALGIPVLGYPAGGIPYMFENGVSGLLVRNEEEFCAAVHLLMTNEKLYNNISEAAIDNARRNFAMERLHAEVFAVYKTLSYTDRTPLATRSPVKLSS